MNPKLLLCLALVLSRSTIVSLAEATNAAPAKSEVVMSLGINGTTNIQTVALGSTNSLNELAPAAVSNFENFVLSASNRVPTNAAKALPIMAVMMKTNIASILTGSGTSEMEAAGEFLSELKKQGRLPGFGKNQHGDATVSSVPFSWLQKATYPFVVTFHVVLTGDSFTNHYTIGRSAHDAPWHLEKAWRTDTDGRTVKEWPVNWIPDLDSTRAEAERGDINAEANLGVMYLNGDRIGQDYVEAAKWLRKAADQGMLNRSTIWVLFMITAKGFRQIPSKL